MEKNLYYRSVVLRRNVMKSFFMDVFEGIASYPRIVLETFTRTGFGHRYYLISTAMTAAFIMAIVPPILYKGARAAAPAFGVEIQGFWTLYTTWYAFLGAVIVLAWKQHIAIRRDPCSFDFSMVSTFAGEVHPAILSFKIAGKFASPYKVATLIEPAIFFIPGVVFFLIGQPIGWLLILTALAYRFSYVAAFARGDEFLWNKSDEAHFNEQLRNTFIYDIQGRQANGVQYLIRKPSSKAVRERLATQFTEKDPAGLEEPISIAQ